MATDFTKAPLEILVDLINYTNGCALTTADISFSACSALSAGSRNTGVTITARPNSVYSGTRDLSYNRVDMATIPGLRSTEFEIGTAVSMKDLIPQINTAYRLNMQPEDYYDDLLPGLDDGGSRKFTLRARPGSYIYRNTLELTIRGDKLPLADHMTNYILNGFTLNTDPSLGNNQVLDGFYYVPATVTATAST